MTTNPDREARRRAIAYAATGLAIAAALVYVRDPGMVTAVPHRLVQLAATAFAFVCGTLSLVRHYSRRERHFLFVGVTFLGAGVFDAFQILAMLRADASAVAAAAAQWGWFASRLFLGLFLARLAIAPRKPARADLDLDEGALYGIAAVLATGGLALLTLVSLPAPGAAAAVVLQLVPAALFLVAIVANLVRGDWRRNAFEHWLIVSLLLGLAAQALALGGPPHHLSAAMLAARFAMLLGYLAIFTGLLASVYFTYGALEESRGALARINVSLQQEIADRQATERELQIRTAFLEQLFESSPEAIVVLDADDCVQRVNAEFTRLFGFTPAEALGRRIGELIVPGGLVAEADTFSADVAAGRMVSAETVRKRQDGSLVDVSILGTPIIVEDGQVGVFGIYRDITDRKRAEEAIRSSIERLAAIIEASPLAIFTIDGHGVIQNWNPAAERLTGLSSEVVLDRTFAELRFDSGGATATALASALAGTTISRAEAVWTRRDGEPLHVSISTAPLIAGDPAAGVLVLAADITDSKRAEQAVLSAKLAAEQANRSKSEFLASMSHELRTPLNSVIGFTKVLLRNRSDQLTPTDKTYLERIAANGEHLLSLINDILDLSKIEAGMLQLEVEPTDLGTLVLDTVAQLEGRTAGGPVALRVDVPAPCVPIDTDAHRLRQVLINLIGNALKFTHEGEVRVTLASDPETGVPLRIDVTDTGIGIAADRLHLIFEAFEQADRSTTRRYGGTGLGLSISRGICAQLGYTLSVESEEGRGSTFSIHLVPAVRASMGEALHA